MTEQSAYVITNGTDYWSNDQGWVDRASATEFSVLETRTLNLPQDGVWEAVINNALTDEERGLLDRERRSLAIDPEHSITAYIEDTTFACDVRNMLIMLGENDDEILAECESDRTLDLARVLVALQSLSREQLTDMCLSYSLCPLHRVDYAICFDDENPECEAIRTIHPSHDT